MIDITHLFWHASLEEIKRGYIFDNVAEEYTCLACGRTFQKGVIYPDGEQLYEAEKFMRLHMEREHVSMFHYLLNLSKKYTGLTDLQKSLLQHFFEGWSDKDVAEKLKIGSTSTIRNHRFALREKEKQAKVYLAMMELLGEQVERMKSGKAQQQPTFARKQYTMTEENQKILHTYFTQGLEGPLAELPTKEKRKIVILQHISHRFEIGRTYTEKEINEIVKAVFPDYVLIRRNLIEYGFLDREPDGSAYWVKTQGEELKAMNRAELKQQYKEMKHPLGILQITNRVNGKILIVSGPNLNGLVNRNQFQLRMKCHPNKELQQDWNQFGEENFTFEIVETLEQSKEPGHDNLADLKTLEEMWLEKLQPYGDQGYNKQ